MTHSTSSWTGGQGDKFPDHIPKNFGIFSLLQLILKRFLGINLTIGLFLLILTSIFSHSGKINSKNKKYLAYQFSGGSINYANQCQTSWYQPLFFLQSFYENPTCLPWLNYISNEFWFFILSSISGFYFRNRPKFELKIMGILALCSLIFAIATDFIYHNEFASVYLLTRHPKPENLPTASKFLTDTATYPWFRLSSYLIGYIYGQILFQKLQNLVTAKNVKSTIKSGWITFLVAPACVVILFFPLPNYKNSTPMYPAWVGILYNSLSRFVWAWLMSQFIYNIELHHRAQKHLKSYQIYNFSNVFYQILANKNWLLLAKLNFSALIIHYLTITTVMENLLQEQSYNSFDYLMVFALSVPVYVYARAFLFHCFIEAPVKILIRKLRI